MSHRRSPLFPILFQSFLCTFRPSPHMFYGVTVRVLMLILSLFRIVVYDDALHDDAINWKHFPRYWPFVRGIHRSPVNSPYKGQWRGALMFSLICTRINGWVNNGEAGDLRRHRTHYDVTAMWQGWPMVILSGRTAQWNLSRETASHTFAYSVSEKSK